jgi:hypothetical protein
MSPDRTVMSANQALHRTLDSAGELSRSAYYYVSAYNYVSVIGWSPSMRNPVAIVVSS